MKDTENQIVKEEPIQTHIGGGAMLEGVMMRGKYSWAVAVREPDGGIYVEEHDVPGYGKRQPWKKWPLVRGCVSLFESLILQFKAMGITAAHAYDFEEDDPENAKKIAEMDEEERARARAEVEAEIEAEKKAATEAAEDKGMASWMVVSMALGVVLGVLLFVFAPAAITNLLVGDYTNENMVLWNLVDGLLRASVFVLYMWLIALMPDIKRMYGYHGAEHKAIHCFEHRMTLVPENCHVYPRQHVRCGTAFIIMTLLVSIVVFTLFPTDYVATALGMEGGIGRFAVVVLSRIVLLPLVAGLSYEVTVRWAGKHPDNPLVKIVLAPGMAMQLITTTEPEDDMLECAIAAMKAVVAREAREEGRELDPDGMPLEWGTFAGGCALECDGGERAQ